LLTGMTGISLHMQWPLTSQSHGSVSQREPLQNQTYKLEFVSDGGLSLRDRPTVRPIRPYVCCRPRPGN
jgi:hypothetical protein